MKNNTTEIHEKLWCSFEAKKLPDQLDQLYKCTKGDRNSFLAKLHIRNPDLAKKLFRNFPYDFKKSFLKSHMKEEMRNYFLDLLSLAMVFRLFKDGIQPPPFPNNTLVLFVRRCISRIRYRTQEYVVHACDKIGKYIFPGSTEGWKAQDLLAKEMSNFENSFLHYFVELNSEQKLYVFKNIPFTEYMQILLLAQLYQSDMIDDHSAINGVNIELCLYGNHLYGGDGTENMEVASDTGDMYIRELLKKKRVNHLPHLMEYYHDGGFHEFWKYVLSGVLERMNDETVMQIIKQFEYAEVFIPEKRRFYLKKGNLNTNFAFLKEDVASGKVTNIAKISSMNQIRLLVED
jgi:hypothetical protein